ncbi:amidase [Achromobacter aloeverae]|nr:amidase [Achromobacter aloeverae]
MTLPFDDTVGAWVPHGHFSVGPTGSGPLDGLGFAAKDLYDVTGHRTGAGNPDWLRTHPPATQTSPLVAGLLDAGAALHGKVITDELAYSIQGENMHYGTPRNTRAPDRVCGGSSSGSAAAVAGGLVDFALGSDTGGSTRVPASYCGLWGLRTTHGLLSTQHVVPLSPLFDTLTWLAARDAVFTRVGDVLLGPPREVSWREAIVLTDACAQADPVFGPLVDAVAGALQSAGLPVARAPASCTDLETWRRAYVTVSAYDAWQTHRDWITREQPAFAPAIAGRWRAAAAIRAGEAAEAGAVQARLRAEVRELLGADRVAVLPSASSAAIARNADPAAVDAIRTQTFRITSIAGLAGLPQVNIPFIGGDGLPAGISLLGPAGSDAALIRLAVSVGRALSALGAHS